VAVIYLLIGFMCLSVGVMVGMAVAGMLLAGRIADLDCKLARLDEFNAAYDSTMGDGR
jgi:MFS superfamily sulfate permease-like transporter